VFTYNQKPLAAPRPSQRRVLTEARPRAEYTKELHLLSNDCTSLRRALIPAQHLVHRLQASPIIAMAEREGSMHGGSQFGPGLKRVGSGNGSKGGLAGGDEGAARPLLSPLTRLYLSDVLDHVDTARPRPPPPRLPPPDALPLLCLPSRPGGAGEGRERVIPGKRTGRRGP
jgi:hypothetical protein